MVAISARVGNGTILRRSRTAAVALWAALGALLGVAILLVGCRLLGAIQPDISLAQVLAGSALVAAILSVLHLFADRLPPDGRPAAAHGVLFLNGLLLTASVSSSATRVADCVAAWVLVVIAEAFWGYQVGLRSQGRQRFRSSRLRDGRPAGPAPPRTDQQMQAAQEAAPEVVQQLTRYCSPQGESLTGFLRATLASNQRSETLHVAFCPPLPAIPQVVVEQVSGPRATVKLGEAQTYGARFELRLLEATAGATDVTVRWQASVPIPLQNTTPVPARAADG